MQDAGLLAWTRQADGDAIKGEWAFEIGQCVRSGGNTNEAAGIITKRLQLIDGRNLYELLKIFDDDGPTGYAIEDGIYSVQHGGQCCAECPLLQSRLCPMMS